MRSSGVSSETRRGGRRRAGALTAWLVCVGCASGEATPAREAVRDSAGVRIVENADVTSPPRWTVEEPPILDVDGGDEPFGLIAGAFILEDGTLAVADALARTVRWFGEDGEETGRSGRPGGGPGEFESLDHVWRVGEGVGVWDGRLFRATTVSPGETFEPSLTLEPTSIKARLTPLGVLADGRLIVASDARALPDSDLYRAELELLAFDEGGSLTDRLASVPGPDMWNWVWEKGVTPGPVPFGRTTSFALGGAGVYVGANEGYQVDRYAPDGRLDLRIRLDRPALSVTPAEIDAYKGAAAERADAAAKGTAVDFFVQMADASPYPESHRHYDGLLVDEEGRLWVRDVRIAPRDPTRLTVFGADGLVVGAAELPARFTPTQIRDGQIAGVWRDELDVEGARVYRIQVRP